MMDIHGHSSLSKQEVWVRNANTDGIKSNGVKRKEMRESERASERARERGRENETARHGLFS